MLQATHTGFGARRVRDFLAATLVVALFGAITVAPASAQNTFYGTGAGAGATGTDDSAFGVDALTSGDSGGFNTAVGLDALNHNTTGTKNTATGVSSLNLNTSGNYNTATGVSALEENTTAIDNTADGAFALLSNTSGEYNTAAGMNALYFNTTGGANTAAGLQALYANTTGGNNIAIGANAGMNLTTGSNNIDIGDDGVAGESDTTRIGTNGMQSRAFIAGVSGKNVKGSEVVISSNGQLGVVKSSARYKRDIRDMGDASSKLMKLRPVTFRYKDDPDGTKQYGLIAEEVARVYPELVARDADGKVESVSYWMLTSMLLNEAQKQAKEAKRKDAQIAALQRQIFSQLQQINILKKKEAQIDALAERMNALERQARRARPEHLVSAMR
jgi:polyhydroxyalkanoate synthesis regulator phasin